MNIIEGKIYRFIYKKQDNTNNVIYGLVDNINNNISIINLNGLLFGQYKYYDVMRKEILFNDRIISFEISDKKFIPHAHHIISYILSIHSKIV